MTNPDSVLAATVRTILTDRATVSDINATAKARPGDGDEDKP